MKDSDKKSPTSALEKSTALDDVYTGMADVYEDVTEGELLNGRTLSRNASFKKHVDRTLLYWSSQHRIFVSQRGVT